MIAIQEEGATHHLDKLKHSSEPVDLEGQGT